MWQEDCPYIIGFRWLLLLLLLYIVSRAINIITQQLAAIYTPPLGLVASVSAAAGAPRVVRKKKFFSGDEKYSITCNSSYIYI